MQTWDERQFKFLVSKNETGSTSREAAFHYNVQNVLNQCKRGKHTVVELKLDLSNKSKLADSIEPRLFSVINDFEEIIKNNGPVESDYKNVASLFDEIHSSCFDEVDGLSVKKFNNFDPIKHLKSEYRRVFKSPISMQGFSFSKPHGYAGDFEIIERIYNKCVSIHEDIERWDLFFHSGSAPNAVRNRSEFIYDKVKNSEYENILSLGCGSACDLIKVTDLKGCKGFTFIDNDQNAISRAKVNHSNCLDKIDFVCKNAFRSDFMKKTYQLVWSAGLFDYLNHRQAVHLLKRVKKSMDHGAEIIIGNFSKNNPSRAYMEIVGEWFLIHRTREDLINILEDAGFDNIDVSSDMTGVNLFASGTNLQA